MGRTKTDYSKTIIYKIVCNDLNVLGKYVGSTTNFTNRKSSHKKCCCDETSRDYNYKVYQMIRLNGGWDNWEMIEIEKFSCKDGNEARTRERHWFEELNADMNTLIPSRSKKEYQVDNADKIKKYNIKYRAEHTEEIKQRKANYRAEHREELNQKDRERRAKVENLDKMKKYNIEYRTNNVEKRKECQKIYRAEHREELNQKDRERRAKKRDVAEAL